MWLLFILIEVSCVVNVQTSGWCNQILWLHQQIMIIWAIITRICAILILRFQNNFFDYMCAFPSCLSSVSLCLFNSCFKVRPQTPGNIGEEYRGEQASWEKCVFNTLKWKDEASKIVILLKEKKINNGWEQKKKPKTPNQTLYTYFSFSSNWRSVILNRHIQNVLNFTYKTY